MTDRLVDLTGPAQLSFDAFADHGAVFASFPRDRQITGGGLGVLWNFRHWPQLQRRRGARVHQGDPGTGQLAGRLPGGCALGVIQRAVVTP